tara:strand:- start:102 stop:569 length:468 start_codon:yes stop_codon:yes gene_type:complete
MKILISACVYGKSVRWNGDNRYDSEIKQWALDNNFELIPVCPENELFGTPRTPIRLRAVGGEIKAFAGKTEVYSLLKNKSKDIYGRFEDVVGFIGIARSPTCGISAGVKDLGSTIKAPMHQVFDCPTTEINSMRTKRNRQKFLERIKKYESRRPC